MSGRWVAAERLQGMACFAFDRGEVGGIAGEPFGDLVPGTAVEKNALPLAGTRDLARPVNPVRFLVFAESASVAPEGADDPWQLACIDRPARFAVADRFGYFGFTQICLVEMGTAELAALGARVLDRGALDYVRGLLVGACAVPAPAHADKVSFQEIMGNLPAGRLRPGFSVCTRRELEAALGESEGPTLERRLEAHRREARLGSLGPYDTMVEEDDGLCRCRVARHRDDGHPALAFYEAQANFAELYRRALDGQVVQRLYDGAYGPLGPQQRDLLCERIWYGSLLFQDCEPVLADNVDDYLDELRAAYEHARAADPGRAVPRVLFERIAALFRRRAMGDVDACAEELEAACEEARSPFRYEFSASFDTSAALARVNLFLPQKALFPLEATSTGLAPLGYSPRVLGAAELEDRYARLACQMGVMTLRLVKSRALWARRLELNAWYRQAEGEGASGEEGPAGRCPQSEPVCLFAVSTGEKDLVRECRDFSRDPFETLRALGAALHRTWDKGLVPVAPAFPLEEGLDHCFGFEAFRKGWTRPYPCRPLGADPGEEELDALVARMGRLAAEGDLAASRALGARVEESYRARWLDPLPAGTRPLSCGSAFEELACRPLLEGGEGSRAELLPRGLARLYVRLAELSREAGCPGDAHDELDRALELAPASPDAYFGLFRLALDEEDEDAARSLSDAAYERCYLARDLAHVYRCWAALAERSGEDALAAALLSYALAVSRDPETVDECMRELPGLRERAGARSPLESDPMALLLVEGYPLRAPEEALETAAPTVERALEGGPLPDSSVLAAYLNAREFPRGADEGIGRLVLCVIGDTFDAARLPDYLCRPVILDGRTLVDFLGEDTPLVDDGDEARLGLLAIPYVDDGRGLLFEVVASVDLATRETARTVAAGGRVTLPGAGLEGEHFLLARPQDYPGLALEERARYLAEAHRTDPARERTRSLRIVDQLRSFERPDEVVAVLAAAGPRPPTRVAGGMGHVPFLGGGLTPEGVWVRLDCVNEDRELEGTLMSEPHEEFGLHAGDSCMLRVVSDRGVPGGVVALVQAPR